ncbi:EscJ/YscJ/HrcJ family type III secretion inner membrane ring protein [Pokkaliibacter plantistimulans]|uniref:Lipoprotein n=1 Tax=Proteobacteria bacterium 228 TaxID=2083153 RepID=A0A2S5KQU6_9PROT|nr:type III secretion inner membrane ring lipoprotein SctJ [Pokkaliibacter plantistimulans]PPC77025.1 EscJ/YscJ/HrcJ family type III secretion inner membrane ring protein [Pokkaliibacter plantistimulans]
MGHYLMVVLLTGMLALLAGCQEQVELNRNLTEADANEVIAELASKHIEADKTITKEGVTVIVDAQDMARAVRILDAAGLPRKSRENMGEVFRKEGVISSPLEERARYIYALSQELESTLSQIDGVLVARVHVVLPERVAPGEPVQPASAAVFIKHRADLDPDVIRPRVERLVRSSIPGLTDKEDKLAVVFVPAEEYHEQQRLVSFGPFLVPIESLRFWQWSLITGALFFLLILIALCLWLKPEWRNALLGRIGLGATGKAPGR